MVTISQVEMAEILKHMPHRHPFLLIDRVLDVEPPNWIRVAKNVTINEPFFAGIPRNECEMPQVLLVEAFAQCCGVLCYFSNHMKPFGGTLSFFAGIENCRFHGTAVPGDQIIFYCVLNRASRGVMKLSGTGSVDGKCVIKLDVTAVMRDRPPMNS